MSCKDTLALLSSIAWMASTCFSVLTEFRQNFKQSWSLYILSHLESCLVAMVCYKGIADLIPFSIGLGRNVKWNLSHTGYLALYFQAMLVKYSTSIPSKIALYKYFDNKGAQCTPKNSNCYALTNAIGAASGALCWQCICPELSSLCICIK